MHDANNSINLDVHGFFISVIRKLFVNILIN